MTVEELQALVADYPKLVSTIQASKKSETLKEAAKQWEPSSHAVTDKSLRPDISYTDDRGQTSLNTVARLVIPLQKQIVRRAASFLCGNPIELKAEPADEKQKKLLAALVKVWEDNKLDYKSKALAKLMMAETEVAELWYVQDVEPDEKYWSGILNDSTKFKLRMRVLAYSLGDSLYPIFGPDGDMIAFGRGYSVSKADGTLIEHFDLYTADNTITGVKEGSGWVTNSVPNVYKKIPVIYYRQEKPEWADVQTLIDRFETQMSNHADTNDYFGSPMLVVTGTITSFAKKGQSGKVMEVNQGAAINYATWTQAPESVKMEMENLLRQIYTCTDTPNISFDEMKGLTSFSGIAFKMLFLSAHLKAAEKEEIFGESVQRRINFLKAVIGVIDTSMAQVQLTVKPKFEYYLPKDLKEDIDILLNAVQGKVLSQETAVRSNPLVEDADLELAKLDEEANSAKALDNAFNTP